MFSWLRSCTVAEKRTFWACLAGWSLDALDVQMFSLVIPAIAAAWHLSNHEMGLVASVTLLTSALGGWLGGALSDRIGRTRALQATVLWFALATFASAFTQSFGQLILAKGLQGLGFGAEWAAGVALMAAVMRPEHRGKALGTIQGGWAVGWGAAVLLYTVAFSLLPPDLAWRVMFGAGLLPAVLVLYVRRHVPEPARPATSARPGLGAALLGIFQPRTLRATLVGLLFGLGAHGGFYGLFTWLPTFLKTERHLSVMGTGAYLGAIIIAFGCGCLAAGQMLDRIGRRLTVALFACGCVVLTVAYLTMPIGPTAMLLLGFPIGFCAAGIPASMGALFSEMYPDELRGSGVGFCYNAGRVVSAALPALIGWMSGPLGLGAAIGIDAAFSYALVLVALLLLPAPASVPVRVQPRQPLAAGEGLGDAVA